MNVPINAQTTGMHTHPVLVKANWQVELDEAIRRNDDAGMWDVIARQEDQEEAQEAMATLVSRLAYRVDGRARFAEMFLLPIIEPAGGDVISNEMNWKAASFAIGEALDGWLPKKMTKTVFNGIRPFDWVGTWRPAVIRSHLQRTLPGNDQARLTTITEEIEYPDEAPRLGFLCMVLTSQLGWPALPAPSTMADKRLRDVVGFALHHTQHSALPIVLTPDRVQFAVVDGVCLWLTELDQANKILGWSATPIANSADVIKITLRLESEKVPMTQFTMRKHQIGLRGVNDVLQVLASLAPVMDLLRDGQPTARDPGKRH